MKYLKGKEEQEASAFMNKAAELALKATCKRAKCGTVIVKGNEIIVSIHNKDHWNDRYAPRVPGGVNETQKYMDGSLQARVDSDFQRLRVMARKE